MSIKLFLLVAVLTVAATQAANPRFRAVSGMQAKGKACDAANCASCNPPKKIKAAPQLAFFKNNCESLKCEWVKDKCGKPKAPIAKALAVKTPTTEADCKAANAPSSATSAEAVALCGATQGCKYDVIAANNYRCCHLPASKKTICASYGDAELVKIYEFPVVKPTPATPCAASSTCCSVAATIDADKAEAGEISGGKCKQVSGACVSPTNSATYVCTSQMMVGTKCGPKPACT